MYQKQFLLSTAERRLRQEAVKYATAPVELSGFRIDALTQARARLNVEISYRAKSFSRIEVVFPKKAIIGHTANVSTNELKRSSTSVCSCVDAGINRIPLTKLSANTAHATRRRSAELRST
jgi:hypothetical protein